MFRFPLVIALKSSSLKSNLICDILNLNKNFNLINYRDNLAVDLRDTKSNVQYLFDALEIIEVCNKYETNAEIIVNEYKEKVKTFSKTEYSNLMKDINFIISNDTSNCKVSVGEKSNTREYNLDFPMTKILSIYFCYETKNNFIHAIEFCKDAIKNNKVAHMAGICRHINSIERELLVSPKISNLTSINSSSNVELNPGFERVYVVKDNQKSKAELEQFFLNKNIHVQYIEDLITKDLPFKSEKGGRKDSLIAIKESDFSMAIELLISMGIQSLFQELSGMENEKTLIYPKRVFSYTIFKSWPDRLSEINDKLINVE